MEDIICIINFFIIFIYNKKCYFQKDVKLILTKKSRSFKRIKNGGDILLLSNDNPLYVVYIYYKEKYWPIFISLHNNIYEHDNYYKYNSHNISRYLRQLNDQHIMKETLFGNYIKDNTYLAKVKINVKDDDITIIEHIMDKVNYENYLPLVKISTKYNKKYIEDKPIKKQINQPIITRNFYKLIQNTHGIIKDIFTTFILSSSIKNKPIFAVNISSEADVSEGSAIDTHMQKIFDSNVFEDGIENAIIVDYLNKNVSIIESEISEDKNINKYNIIQHENMYDDKINRYYDYIT